MKGTAKILFYISMRGALCSSSIVEADDIRDTLRQDQPLDTFVAATDDTNREERTLGLVNVLNRGRDENNPLDKVLVGRAMAALGEIGRTATPLTPLKTYFDDASQRPALRGEALRAYAKVALRAQGVQAMIGLVQPYLLSPEFFLANPAREALAGTNTPQALNLLQARLTGDLSVLPSPGLVVTEMNGKDIEAHIGAVVMDAVALHSMDSPVAKAQAQETLRLLRGNYSSGPARAVVQELERRIATP